MLRAVDLFCGAGGTSTGAEQSGRVSVALAVNHWGTAIQTHKANHPHVRHIQTAIDLVDPREFARDGINLVMASPECIFHSNARGGRPVDDQRRSTAWCVPRWVEVLRPKWFVIENVREFEQWGPLGCDNRPLKSKAGEIFQAWVNSLKALNYDVEWRMLNAADYGGATKRVRLFIVGRRGHSRAPIPFPVPSHAKEQWTPAASIIDWSLPCPSIFGRKRPLADKTLRRIEIGLRKFCGPGAAAFMVRLRRNGTAAGVDEPLGTVTAGGNHEGLAVPFTVGTAGPTGSAKPKSVREPLNTVLCENRFGLAAPFFLPRQGYYDCRQDRPARSLDEPLPVITANHGPGQLVMPFISTFHNGNDGHNRNGGVDAPLPTIDTANRHAVVTPNFGERDGQEPRTHDVGEPLPTVTGHGAGGLVAPFLVDSNHGDGNGTRSAGGRVHSLDSPLGSLTTHHGKSLVFPFLTNYYGTGHADSVDEPLATVTTKDRHGLALVKLVQTMQELGVVDIGFRMLEPHELAAAQGFPSGYEIYGSKADQVKQIGNSVHVAVSKAICDAIGRAA